MMDVYMAFEQIDELVVGRGVIVVTVQIALPVARIELASLVGTETAAPFVRCTGLQSLGGNVVGRL